MIDCNCIIIRKFAVLMMTDSFDRNYHDYSISRAVNLLRMIDSISYQSYEFSDNK